MALSAALVGVSGRWGAGRPTALPRASTGLLRVAFELGYGVGEIANASEVVVGEVDLQVRAASLGTYSEAAR